MIGSGVVVWFTGLPQSGKSTLAARLRDQLAPGTCAMLDGDEVRAALGITGHGEVERDAFYRMLGALAGLLARQGLVVLVPATAPRRAHREAARAVAPRFAEVWVRTTLADAEARDTKDLYARARAGALPALPGVGVPYEAPGSPEVIAEGGHDEAALAALVRLCDVDREALERSPARPLVAE